MAVGEDNSLRSRACPEASFGRFHDFVYATWQTGIHQYPFATRSPDEIKVGKTYRQPTDIGRNSRDQLGHRNMERVTRLELATSSLARRCSTTELHPHSERVEIMAKASLDATFNCHEKRQIVESKARVKRISLTMIPMKTLFITSLCSIVLACTVW